MTSACTPWVINRSKSSRADEIRALFKACDEINGTYRALIKVLPLTGQRLRTVAKMRWDDIKDGGWTIRTEKREKGNAGAVRLPTWFSTSSTRNRGPAILRRRKGSCSRSALAASSEMWGCSPIVSRPHFGRASCTIGHHNFCSASMKRARSAAKIGRNGDPICSIRKRTSGFSSALRRSSSNCRAIASGVPLGAKPSSRPPSSPEQFPPLSAGAEQMPAAPST